MPKAGYGWMVFRFAARGPRPAIVLTLTTAETSD